MEKSVNFEQFINRHFKISIAFFAIGLFFGIVYSLNLLGFNVIETLICTSGNNLNSAFENNELMKTAYEIGNLF